VAVADTLRLEVQMVPASPEKATSPLGWPAPGDWTLTVAVKVMVWSVDGELLSTLREVEVRAGDTCSVSTDELEGA
jgi:hypothetical protein